MKLLLFISVFSFGILSINSCQTNTDEDYVEYVHIPPIMPDSIYAKLQDGDIIMRKGTGPLSFYIMNATKENYSHCGIIVKEDDKWRVIHAMGGGVSKDDVDGMQIMDLNKFVSYAADSMLYICRADFQDSLGPKIRDAAYGYLDTKAPFDHSFNLFDKDRIYCSELIFLILRDITGKNQFIIRKKHKSYLLLFETFFDTDKYEKIFDLRDLGTTTSIQN